MRWAEADAERVGALALQFLDLLVRVVAASIHGLRVGKPERRTSHHRALSGSFLPRLLGVFDR